MRKKDIQGYEGLYYVTDTGEVWSYDKEYTLPIHNIKKVKKGRKISPSINGKNKKGYYCVKLYNHGVIKNISIHRLVATAFIKKIKNKTHVNHKNGNKLDNNFANLEWATPSQNMIHAYKTGLNKPPATAKLNYDNIFEIRKLLRSGLACRQISKMFSVCPGTIELIKNKKTWKHVL